MATEKIYFGGTTVTGKVRQLAATCWRELVESYINVPVQKKFTRKEFDTYDEDTQKKFKDGPFITPAWFTGNEVDRRIENCLGVNLVMMDFDSLSAKDLAEGFVDYATQLYEGPEVVKDALYPLNFALCETASSRAGRRRVRLVVDVASLSVADYKRAVATVASMLGIEINRWKGRTESLVACQPMYRPVQYAGEDLTAVLVTRTNGVELDELDLLPDSAFAGNDELRSYGYVGSGDDFDMMHLPVAGLTIEDVAAALKHIDPDCTRPLWVKVGMALRHQFRGNEEAKAAYDTFDDWSSQGDKYVDEDDTYSKWKSFKPEAVNREPVTIRSLFEMAKEGGWDPKDLAKKVKVDFGEWVKRCNDPELLMHEGPRRIAALPFQNDMTEEAMCNTLQDRIKGLNGQTISKANILKSIKSSRRAKKVEEDDDIPAWGRVWVMIGPRNVFRNVVTGVEMSTAAFDNVFSVELMNHSPDSDSMATGRPAFLPTHYLLNMKKSKRVDGTTYDPTQEGAEPFFTHGGQTFLNEFRQSTIPRPDPKRSKAAGRLFTQLVEQVVGVEHAPIILDFFAHIFQFPGVPVRWAPLIQSAEGAGKNVMCNAVGFALGVDQANFKVINAKAILSDYNEWCGGAQLLVLDEIKLPGSNKADLMNRLKDMITNDTISISEKFKSLQIQKNVSCKIAFTNYQDALHMEETDRRWMPIKSPIQTKAESEAIAKTGKFDEYVKLYTNGGALRQFFLDRHISPDFPVNGPAPKTEFRKEMISESKNRLQEEIEDLIDNPECPMVAADVIFMPAMTSRLAQTKDNYKPSHFLRRMGYELHKQGMKLYIGATRGTVWVHRDNHDPDMGDPVAILKERMEKETDF